MLTAKRLEKAAAALAKVVDEGTDLNTKRQKALRRIVDQINTISVQHANDLETARQAEAAAEEEARRVAVEQVYALAAEHGLTVHVLDKGNKVDSNTIRTWAMENNVEVNRLGIIPKRVRDAYFDAHRG